MKPNENKFQKRNAVLALFRECLYGHPIGDDVPADAIPQGPPELRPSHLERITQRLRDLGLDQRVHVRFDETGGDYVLEDADGLVHARDYDNAVKLIERIWLYQP